MKTVSEQQKEIRKQLASLSLQDFTDEIGNYRLAVDAPLARAIDHTLLKVEATTPQFARLFTEALAFNTISVCVPSNRVQEAAVALKGSGVRVCTVIGFPNGYASTGSKLRETQIAFAEGCEEFDMVVPVGIVKDGNIAALYADVRAVVEGAKGRLVKVILETSALTDDEKILAGTVALAAGAHFLKTSTGFGAHGATVEDIRLLRSIAGDRAGVKASGGIRDYDFARTLLDAGADRIGTSSTGKILEEAGR